MGWVPSIYPDEYGVEMKEQVRVCLLSYTIYWSMIVSRLSNCYMYTVGCCFDMQLTGFGLSRIGVGGGGMLLIRETHVLCGWSQFSTRNEHREVDIYWLVCNHMRHMMIFVKDHPSLSAVEFDIYDGNLGNFLIEIIPIINVSHCGQHKKSSLHCVREKVTHQKKHSQLNSISSGRKISMLR